MKSKKQPLPYCFVEERLLSVCFGTLFWEKADPIFGCDRRERGRSSLQTGVLNDIIYVSSEGFFSAFFMAGWMWILVENEHVFGDSCGFRPVFIFFERRNKLWYL